MSDERAEQGSTTQPGSQMDGVRATGVRKLNRKVDQQTWECLSAAAEADRESITAHIGQLTLEKDMERYLQTNASLLALAGTLLGAATRKKKWLVIPGIVLPFLLQHAIQGWCPPAALFLKMGVRTRKEINRERYALKAIRGDFGGLAGPTQEEG